MTANQRIPRISLNEPDEANLHMYHSEMPTLRLLVVLPTRDSARC